MNTQTKKTCRASGKSFLPPCLFQGAAKQGNGCVFSFSLCSLGKAAVPAAMAGSAGGSGPDTCPALLLRVCLGHSVGSSWPFLWGVSNTAHAILCAQDNLCSESRLRGAKDTYSEWKANTFPGFSVRHQGPGHTKAER